MQPIFTDQGRQHVAPLQHTMLHTYGSDLSIHSKCAVPTDADVTLVHNLPQTAFTDRS